MSERADSNTISWTWGLTEAQWHERVQSAVARAEVAESAVSTLREALAATADELDRWGWGDFHYGEQPQQRTVQLAVERARAALASTPGDPELEEAGVGAEAARGDESRAAALLSASAPAIRRACPVVWKSWCTSVECSDGCVRVLAAPGE